MTSSFGRTDTRSAGSIQTRARCAAHDPSQDTEEPSGANSSAAANVAYWLTGKILDLKRKQTKKINREERKQNGKRRDQGHNTHTALKVTGCRKLLSIVI